MYGSSKKEKEKEEVMYITTRHYCCKCGKEIDTSRERKRLYEIINKRVDKMIEAGLVDEVKIILKKGYKKEDPGLKTIGYKEIIDYLEDKSTLEDSVNMIKKNSRRYAKRQLTWFRAVDDVKWFENDEIENIERYLKEKMSDILDNFLSH